MSRIDKLAILGVRSFDNTRTESIQFHTPLTLIVGYNGSGKTTIIECLKYATTGDLPPNSKGGAFIHDPKMCGEKEVLAQVKLSFKSINGAKMVCTRSLQLTVKKTTRQQKTLEGQLLVVRNGERSTISSRCAELDMVMPQYLGVSKAVLDYVIFCHQDESLWPLSEPAALKKRFDEIFEALKYTKAIDNIKVLRKKQNEELGKLRILLEQYRTDKDRAEKAKRRSDELHEEIETMRVRVTNLSTELQSIAQEQKTLFETARGFEHTLATLEMKRQEAVSKQSHLQELSQHMDFLEDSDEKLHEMHDDYERRLRSYEQHVQNKKAAYNQLKVKLEQVRTQLGNKLTEEGRIQAQRKQYEGQLREREDLVREISVKHDMKGFSGELDDEQIQEFMAKITRMSRDQGLVLERIKRENESSISWAQNDLNGLVNKRSSLRQKKEYAQSEIKNLDRKVAEYKRNLDSLNVDSGQEAMAKDDLSKREIRLEEARAKAQVADNDGSLQVENAKLRKLEEDEGSVTEELFQGSKNAELRAQLAILKQNLETRQKVYASLIAAKKDKIDSVVGKRWSESTVEKDLQAVLDQREEEQQEAIRQREIVNQQVSQIDTKLGIAKDSLKRKQDEASKCEATVVQSWELEDGTTNNVNDYPDALKDLEAQRAAFKQGEFMLNYLNSAVAVAERKNACVLCRRGFKDEDEKSSRLTEFRKQIEKVLKNADEEVIRGYEEDIEILREAGPSYDSYVRLTSIEIPALETEIKQYQKAKEKLLEQYTKLDKIVDDKSNASSEVQSLRAPVAELARYKREIDGTEEEINSMTFSMTDMGGTRTIEELQEDSKRLKEKITRVKNLIRSMEQDRENRRQSIIGLERQVNDARKRLNDITLQLVDVRQLTERIEECSVARSRQNAVIDEVDRELENLAPDILAAEARLKEISRECSEKETKQQRDAAKLSQSDMNLKSIQRGISNYINEGGLHSLEECRGQVQRLRADVEQLGNDVTEASDLVAKLEKEAVTTQTTQRTIIENLRYRKNKVELKKIKQEIKELEAQRADEQRERFEKNAEILANKHSRLSSERSALVGEMRSKDKQLEQLVADYATDYADAKDKYKETLAKVHTTTSATNDLGKYGAALDKAVMKYHSLKMEEINRIIEELWKSTYRGTDVDTILIRSDNETGKGNRSYNYRVCMVKQDAEMDMRGRCSAGQKVLASIIIRLALAECFGINCGLIALDEPTTNLDQDNIRSLARSLHEIIRTRQSQANFQLIVITHDEEFLKEMNCQDYCDNYYRISRNDRQKSIIGMQSIAEVI
ncbi:AAA domain-containing protein [Tricharina praecox]|uniref:AAA domain-containing protein n=1 Tax=Tricharina praecox TaxID=43433 RepID=UPI00221F43A0|nr:AAA domain-containing protein [Tricharina praecox]KAI5850625.1 AAA domain-containing protein [Tricharina praecox]